jgi:hypothetical protein
MNAAAQKINVFASVEPNGLELLASRWGTLIGK